MPTFLKWLLDQLQEEFGTVLEAPILSVLLVSFGFAIAFFWYRRSIDLLRQELALAERHRPSSHIPKELAKKLRASRRELLDLWKRAKDARSFSDMQRIDLDRIGWILSVQRHFAEAGRPGDGESLTKPHERHVTREKEMDAALTRPLLVGVIEHHQYMLDFFLDPSED